ncbi:MAG: protein NO VEIN domain-containing protein [Polaromonas sp.]|jgi:hypothetical protein
MVPVGSKALFDEALSCLMAHKKAVGSRFRGRPVQIFLGMKFFQNSIPSMYSGSFITTEVLQALLDDLFAKASRPANTCVLSIFEGNFLARTGLIGPGNSSAQNTWRNNLNLQKGVGCYAPAADLASLTFLDQSRADCKYLLPVTPGSLSDAKCSLCTSGAAYRSESQRKWLRIDPSGNGYAATDLQLIANFSPYLAPGGVRIPILPLIVALYHDADPGLVIGNRPTVSLAEFAADFNLSAQEVSAYFDASTGNQFNARLINSAAWASSSGATLAGAVATNAAPPPALTGNASGVKAQPTPKPVPAPNLHGTPTPPPNANNGWDAEQYVAAALTAAGWTTYAVARQQLGYDIFAERGIQKRYVEVKSSLGPCSPSLTAREWQQAKHHAATYVLAIVENFNPTGENVVYWVRDPANQCSATPQTTISHSIARSSWTSAAIPLAQI